MLHKIKDKTFLSIAWTSVLNIIFIALGYLSYFLNSFVKYNREPGKLLLNWVTILILIAVPLSIFLIDWAHNKKKITNLFSSFLIVLLLFILYLNTFFVIYRIEHVADSIKRGSNYINETASILYFKQVSANQLIKDYNEIILEKRVYDLPGRPLYPEEINKDLKRTSVTSHPPGSILFFNSIYDHSLGIFPKLNELDGYSDRIFNIGFVLVMVAGLSIPGAYLLARAFDSSILASTAVAFLSLGIIGIFAMPSLTDGMVAGLVILSIYFLVLTFKNNIFWVLISGLFAALSLFITFGVASILIVSFITLAFLYSKKISKILTALLLYLLPVALMIFYYAVNGFNYFEGMLSALRNIREDYNVGKLYLVSLVVNSETIALNIGLVGIFLIIVSLIFIISKYFSSKLLQFGIIASAFWLFYANITMYEYLHVQKLPLERAYGIWIYGLPLLIFVTSLIAKKFIEKKETISASMVYFIIVSTLLGSLVISGQARGEMARTNMFFFPVIIGSMGFIFDKMFKFTQRHFIAITILVSSLVSILFFFDKHVYYYFLGY